MDEYLLKDFLSKCHKLAELIPSISKNFPLEAAQR